ncbi:pyruvate dehydrogenase [Enterobacteriaceae endosymbiont of Macroplea mutica]|uniref:2-oxo acid dehydrogenase subunit E2 n=1 Tax=Enterobacteriaceae endosymbiont of Macroplea mutica TaxID=2675791 RepID=UPI00144A17BE|nr:2-oxo acid dehydrogenase subunit E2 [Enterobacteriaceae endosymbiont of Macroplea mutica]QJC31239.1 pyruvate dehydrogenase [Enterobacteriaceae endosymbiont of Macroplea mutica]
MNNNIIILPDIGNDNMKVTEILVQLGDYIYKDQSIIVVESDKTSIEVPADQEGEIKKICVNVGDIVHTNSPILILLNKEKLTNNTLGINSTKQNKIHNTINILVPDIGIQKMLVKKILVNEKEQIQKNQSLVIIQDKTNIIEIASLYAGYINTIHIKLNSYIKSNDIIITLCINKISNENIILNYNMTSFIKKNNMKGGTQIIQKQTEPEYFYATPYIRKIARQFNINLSTIKGSGNKNRITKEDIMQYIKNNNLDNVRTNDKNIHEKYGPIEIIILNNIQKATSINLTNNWKNIPHVTQHIQADITELESFRIKKNYELKNTHNIKITILSFMIKICAHALKQFPYFNSSIIDETTLILKKYYNIGIAVNTPQGLIVPIIFNVLDKNIIEISKEIILLANKAKNNKLMPQDIKGGCFTISNLGQLRSNFFTPIINAPEVSILGISQAMIQPIWDGNKFIPKLMLPLSLSYDHRIINGVDGVMFLNFICDLISDIRNLLI